MSSVNIKHNYIESERVGKINERQEHPVDISTSVMLRLLKIWHSQVQLWSRLVKCK